MQRHRQGATGRLHRDGALLGGIAGGAEKADLPETGITLEELSRDVEALVDAFDSGRTFYLAVTGEDASEHYTTDFIANLFEAEGGGRFTVRKAIVGHMQQGGVPSPFDRINATRLAYSAIVNLDAQVREGTAEYMGASSAVRGLMEPMRELAYDMDWDAQRPKSQWWVRLRAVFDQLSRKPGQE